MKCINCLYFLTYLFLFCQCAQDEVIIEKMKSEQLKFEITNEEKMLLSLVAKPQKAISIERAQDEAEELSILLDMQGGDLNQG